MKVRHPSPDCLVVPKESISDPEEKGRVEKLIDEDATRHGGGDDTSSDDSVQMYLREIGLTPLLTAHEEKILGSQVEKGKHLASARAEAGQRFGPSAGTLETMVVVQHRLSRASAAIDEVYRTQFASDAIPMAEKFEEVAAMLDQKGPRRLSVEVTQKAGGDSQDLETALLNLWLDLQLIPKDVLAALNNMSWPEDAESQIERSGVLKSMKPHQEETTAHFVGIDHDSKMAQDKLVTSNLRLVVGVARKYQRWGLPLMDLVQEGNTGLIRAVQKFDHRKGHKFSTYATWWIRQAITRAIACQARTIRLPVHMEERLSRLRRLKSKMRQANGCEPTDEELAAQAGYPVDLIQQLYIHDQWVASLDKPVGESEDTRLEELVGDFDGPSVEELALQTLLHQELDEVMSSELSAREKHVLQLRFGFGEMREHTLAEVGRVFGVTRERARQIEEKALAKMRQPDQLARLMIYM